MSKNSRYTGNYAGVFYFYKFEARWKKIIYREIRRNQEEHCDKGLYSAIMG
ncbi:hypothetical protein KKC1_03110 [Calderihabitans maritimus]|uniref:Uncharacterized protein n=1 Tax=Calderihabitans maritimus TaxID=1246530 RepID=A0A1Z5HNP3_9FIRM|nr:hypothetical protein KKC1_03110 [Calderihabitans maritimus]